MDTHSRRSSTRSLSISSWSTLLPNKSFTQIKRQSWLDLTHYVDTAIKAWGWADAQDPPTIKEHSYTFTPAFILCCIFTDALYLYVFTQIFELEGLTLQVVGDYDSNYAAASQQGFTMVVFCALKAGLLAGWLTVFWGPKFDLLLASQPISNATH